MIVALVNWLLNLVLAIVFIFVCAGIVSVWEFIKKRRGRMHT